ncbi:hypothetical protein MLD38_037835 [Melastoma candidum]|uniref:Uncharacterized protein n=1 Tax=Melastoma candidum TaxID=119954 RepID=A0ACB9LP36_9MYRT|nr:hypothetical protein MLD38_037835 [Melastoma candidum]
MGRKHFRFRRMKFTRGRYEKSQAPQSSPIQAEHANHKGEDGNEENEQGSCKKRRTDDGDNEVVEEGGDGHLKGQISPWEKAIFKMAREKLNLSEEATRLQMASVEPSVRDLMMNNWFKEKEVLDKSTDNLRPQGRDVLKYFF